jgi:hypothetical protein
MQRSNGLYESCVIDRNDITPKFDPFDIPSACHLTQYATRIIMQDMDGQNTSTDEAVRTLLERTAAMQTSIEAIAASMSELRAGQVVLQGAVTALQVDVAAIKATMTQYVTHEEVQRIRADLFKALNAQTWRLLIWMTAVCSGLVGAVYYIARNVH